MRKMLAFLLAGCLLLTALSCAQAQPLEDLIVGLVRDEEGLEARQEVTAIPNMDETMGVQGVSQGGVDAYGMLRGEAFLYVFASKEERVQAAWRLDSALTKRGFTPGDFPFEGATYTLYASEGDGGILLMDGVTECATMIVLAGNFRQEEAKNPERVQTAQAGLSAEIEGAPRRYLYVDEKADDKGVMMTFSAAEPASDGYDVMKIYFPLADEAPEGEITLVLAPEE